MIRFTSNEPISIEAARNIAPAIFSDQKDIKMSEEYVQLPTHKVVEKMEAEGFRMFSIQQTRPSKRNINTAKHMIRFRHDSLKPLLTEVGKEFFEILLVNSHNGSSCFNLYTGIFRLVCLNGMVVSKMNVDFEKYRHSNVTIDNIIDASYRVINNYEKVTELKRSWEAIELTNWQKNALAEAAIHIKYEDRYTPFKPADFLQVMREEDNKNDLWTVFNVIQEHLINGQMSTRNSRGRLISTRGINNIGQNISFNQRLWDEANKFATIDI